MPSSAPAVSNWFVARTQPSRERWAAENCLRQGAEAYLPFIIERNVISRGRLLASRLKPLFPGYLFVRTFSGQWRFLRGTFGLIDVMLFGDTPATVSQAIIEDLKQREADGAVQLPPTQRRLFDEKDSVRVADGPFEGKLGLVEGYNDADRVRVLLDLLGRKVPVLFAEGQLLAA